MNSQTPLQRLFHFFLVKIIIAVALIAGSVALVEWSGRLLLDSLGLAEEFKNFLIAVLDSVIAVFGYILLFSHYEKRSVSELSTSSLGSKALTGFVTGFLLQSFFILILFISGSYSIQHINPLKSLLPSFSTALSAGFVAEIIIRGVIFRITEEKFGTWIALGCMTVLFALMHINVAGASLLSVLTTAIQAGLLLSAAYVFTRSLWFPIFLHFAWDFAEPGIYGAINPGNSIHESLISAGISGPDFLTGGQMGPQNSVQALILCSLTGMLFLWLAYRKNKTIQNAHGIWLRKSV